MSSSSSSSATTATSTTTSATPYEDLFSALNSHLFKEEIPKTSKITPDDVAVVTTGRRGFQPKKNEKEVYSFLKRKFGFSEEALKNPHVLTYAKQSLIFETTGGGDGCEAIAVIDVNYKWSNTYYHFLTEVVPNVLLALKTLESCFQKLTNENIFIFTQINPNFTLQWFKWFGIDDKRCFQITNECISSKTQSNDPEVVDVTQNKSTNNIIKIKCRFVECGNISPERVKILRENFKIKRRSSDATKEGKQQLRVGVFVKRDGGNREIVNEKEVISALSKIFKDEVDEWVVFTTLPPDETFSLFSKAKVIVGPHGAGLTNMIFCNDPSEVKVIELTPLNYINICYWHLSEVLGINDYMMIPFEKEIVDSNLNFFVDIELLTHFLTKK